MKSLTMTLCLATFTSVGMVYSGDAACHRCISIREYNKEHHKNYEYYEDYLKEQDSTDTRQEERAKPSESQVNPTPDTRPNAMTPKSVRNR